MDLAHNLEKFGLTVKQAKVYLASLELGGGKVSKIARRADIKRTTCYTILADLRRLGLVVRSEHKKTDFFVAENPKNLEKKEKEKLEVLNTFLPQLQAVYNRFSYKPKISFYEGWEGVKTIYEDSLENLEKGDVLFDYGGFTDYFQYMPKSYADSYVRRRVGKGIIVKIIAPTSKIARQVQSVGKRLLREMRLVSKDHSHFSGDWLIYKNKVGIISFKDNFMGILIESKEVTEMFKMAFKLMWKGADRLSDL